MANALSSIYNSRKAKLAREMSHGGSGYTPTQEEINTSIDVGMGKKPHDVAYGEKGLYGGMELGRIGDMPVSITDILPADMGANALATLGKLGAAKLGALPFVGLAGHTAWHGSPHIFNKFAKEAIGTGEGAQAYGHGLYLAENPKVALTYKNKLAKPNLYPLVDGIEYPSDFMGGRLHRLAEGDRQGIGSFSLKQSSFEDIKNELSGLLQKAINAKPPKWAYKKGREADLAGFQKNIQDSIATYTKWNNELDSIQGKKIILPDMAHLYKTDIPDEHINKMLDWDKPLSAQSKHVQDAINNFANKYGDFYPGLNDALQPMERNSTTGQTIHNLISESNRAGGARDLQSMGIPGIKYLDGTSRSAGEGTRNFVMFNPDDIRILERNGIPTGQVPWSADTGKNSFIDIMKKNEYK